MGVESNARIMFGWEHPTLTKDIYWDVALGDSAVYDIYTGQLNKAYMFTNKTEGALPFLGMHEVFHFDESTAIAAHKGFQIRCRGLEVAALVLPSKAEIEKMSKELKADALTLGLDLELLGEPKFLLSSGETWQGEDD